MADLLLLTPAPGGSAQVLPALGLLSHRVRVLPVEPSALVDAPDADLVLLDARRDLAMEHSARGAFDSKPTEIASGDLNIDASGYTARLRGRPLDLTYKEFELIKYLVQHPGRVFTRAQLLQEVWGYDYYGGTRTVDVHVRRLRAKLGTEHEQLIGTVRNVGYRFDPPKERRPEDDNEHTGAVDARLPLHAEN